MAGPIIETVALATPWATVDPFLFCVHHLDHYPASDGSLAPDADLAGRQIGNDFAGADGWSMYHGSRVPGFPQHPHRGFETLTFVRSGLIDHADSLGATARFGRGDAQWMTAGKGIVHSEMFPLLNPDGPNPLELFQIWINLPAADKMVDPHFAMLWDEEIPQLRFAEAEQGAPATTVTVVAGRIGSAVAPPPPPSSWAARVEGDVAVWHISMEAGAAWTLPAAVSGSHRMLYLYEGSAVDLSHAADGSGTVAEYTGALVRCDEPVDLIASSGAVEILVLQGRPIGEPVASHGPFVMNTRAELQEAFDDYHRTQFGGWPWPSDDPVHGMEPERFARHADGRVEQRTA